MSIGRARVEPRILVVEDHELTRNYVTDTLTAGGFVVTACSDGITAMQLIRSGLMPAAIVTDIRMPGLRGDEFIHLLRAYPRLRHVPIVAITAGDEAPDGITLLQKPFTPEALLECVHQVVEGTPSVAGPA